MALRLIRALPGERPLLSPLPRRHGAAWIDARVAAPGPHDFAVRPDVSSGEKHLTSQRPSHPAPTCRDDHDTSLSGTGRAKSTSDLRNCQETLRKNRRAGQPGPDAALSRQRMEGVTRRPRLAANYADANPHY